MYFRVEILSKGKWLGLFRGVDYIFELKKKDAKKAEEMKFYLCNELHSPPSLGIFNSRSWFTEFGFRQFEKRADLFLDVLSEHPSVKDIRIRQLVELPKGEILFSDDHQVIILNETASF